MRIKFLLFTLTLFLAQRAALAQNSDLGFLAGVSGPGSDVVSGVNSYVHGSVGASGQINYAWQVFQHVVDLYVEMPLVISGRSDTTVTPTSVYSCNCTDVFFTPGLRVKISPQSRVSFYGALGGGLGSFGGFETTVGRGSVTTSTGRTNTAALGFGGGLDFRLTRLLSLRVEGRDFVTRTGLGGTAGRNHSMFQVGIAFHF